MLSFSYVVMLLCCPVVLSFSGSYPFFFVLATYKKKLFLFVLAISAFLDYYDIPYKVVEVNPLSKKEIKWSDYKKVPILMVNDEQLVDSSGHWRYYF